MDPATKPCPECGSTNLRVGKIEAQAGFFDLLPHIGSMGGRLESVVCLACGCMRLFVPGLQRKRIEKSKHWRPLDAPTSESGGAPTD